MTDLSDDKRGLAARFICSSCFHSCTWMNPNTFACLVGADPPCPECGCQTLELQRFIVMDMAIGYHEFNRRMVDIASGCKTHFEEEK